MIRRLVTGGCRLLLVVALVGWIIYPSCSKKKPTSVEYYPLPSAPAIYSPRNGATGEAVNTIFGWEYTAGSASGYTVQISADSTFASPAVNQNTASYQFTAPELDPHTKYFWRVRAYNPSHVSNWSEIRSFTTGPGKLVSSVRAPGFAHSIAVQGGYSYLVSDSGLQVINISDPAVPRPVGMHRAKIADGKAIVVAGAYVYIATYDGLLIINVSSPSAPTLIGKFQSGQVADVAVSDNYAYLIMDPNSSNSRMEIVDISNPSTPKLVTTWHVKPDSCWKGPCYNSFRGIALQGYYAYLAANYGLEVVKISNPTACSLATRYNAGYPRDVAITGTHAYLYNDDPAIHIVDISNQTAPKYAGTYHPVYGGAQSISISGEHAFLIGSNETSGRSLEILELSNPVAPTSVGRYNGVEGAAGDDSLVYAAAGENGFKILKFAP